MVSMKRTLLSLVLIVGLVCPLAMQSGCTVNSGSPTTQPAIDPLKIAEDTVTAAVVTLNTLKLDGKISQADWNNIYLPAINGVNAALNSWENAPAGSNAAQVAESAFFAA